MAIFDYDSDGWPNIFLVNGTTLEGSPPESAPSKHLYHNNHDGTFSDVTAKVGLLGAGWGQGVCMGDYDNDGREDIYVTCYGKNPLYHNLGGKFEEVAEKAGVAGDGKSWGRGCAFVDYDRDGHLDLIIANYADFDLAHIPLPEEFPTCLLERHCCLLRTPQSVGQEKYSLSQYRQRSFPKCNHARPDRSHHGARLFQCYAICG